MSKQIHNGLRRMASLTASLALVFAIACASESLPLDESNGDDGGSLATSSKGKGGLGDKTLPLKTIELVTDVGWHLNDLALVGDLDGDGYDDWAVAGGPFGDLNLITSSGTLHLFYGRPSYPDQLALDDADAVIEGALTNTVSALGDIDADGYPDFGFSTHCPLPEEGSEFEPCDERSPGLHLIYGGPERYSGTLLSHEVGVHWKPDVPNVAFKRLSAAGDVNGDGRDDIAFDYSVFSSNSVPRALPGRSVLLFGRSARSEQASEPGFADAFFEVSGDITWIELSTGVGDVDADGYADFAISASNDGTEDNCRTELFYGGPERFEGAMDLDDFDAAFDACGLTESLGDLDNDGFADFGFSKWDGLQPVHVVYGESERLSGISSVPALFSAAGAEPWIRSFAAGDLDADGDLDLLVTKFDWASQGPEAHALLLVPGDHSRFEGSSLPPESGFPADKVLLYGQPGEMALPPYETTYSLSKVESGSDVNGDGYDDVLVEGGNYYVYDSRVYLLFGAPRD